MLKISTQEERDLLQIKTLVGGGGFRRGQREQVTVIFEDLLI